MAGALFTLLNRPVSIKNAWRTTSAEVLIESIPGGVNNFSGWALGAALILLDQRIAEVTEYWPTVP